MIIGIGIDLVDIRRIEKSLQRSERFEEKLFTESERKKARGRKKAGKKIVAATYAKHFAAKEACAKALGLGFQEKISWQDMEIKNLPSGAPAMHLKGAALKRLKSLTPKGREAIIHVSLSDEYPYAQAQVIISAEPV